MGLDNRLIVAKNININLRILNEEGVIVLASLLFSLNPLLRKSLFLNCVICYRITNTL